MTAVRLPAPFGALLDRSRQISFSFEGKAYTGFAGDTIASALAANGQWMLSRSFKYHRPRGIVSAAGLEASTVVQVGSEPNVYADKRAIADGLSASAVNTFGGLAHDKGRILEKFSRFLPVGFYYRTFYTPRAIWKFWEPVIRKMAGLGTVDPNTPHGYYDKAYLFADVAVIGGGVAGLSAALAAAESGAEVLLIDDNPYLSGALAYARTDAGRLGKLATQAAAHQRITILTDAACQGLFSDNWLSVTQGNRLYKVRAKSVVAATGAHEQPAVFRGNDTPGVMLGTAAQRLMRLWAVKPGNRAVILAANDDAYGVALDLFEAGVRVAAVADLRTEPSTDPRVKEVKALDVPVHTGTTVAEAVEGNNHVRAVRLAPVTGQGQFGVVGEAIACDLVCVSVGYVPLTQILSQGGASLVPDENTCMPRIASLPQGLFAAGSVAGVWAWDAVAQDGVRAGKAAAAHAGLTCEVPPPVPSDGVGLTHPHPIFPHPKGKDFIEFDEDVQIRDIFDAAAMGWDHIQLLKRFSTAGMGPSQGKLYNALVQKALSTATGITPPTVGTITVRPPIYGEKLGHLAGRGFEPKRLTAMHHQHIAAGARMLVAGLWMRPAYYGQDATAATLADRSKQATIAMLADRSKPATIAIAAEVHASRNSVGMIDVSTLGKLELRGPAAAEFMERIYTGAFKKQAVGGMGYALMLDESGVIIDDGITCRLHEQHFYVTASTGGVDRVFRLMQFYNAQWRMPVDIANVTAAYAGISVLGPRSRDVLNAVGVDLDLSREVFPYMTIRMGTVAGIPARILRMGFGGELGFEIHIPTSRGAELWERIATAGAAFGIRPVGIEAQRILRLEKGHTIAGQDTDGLTHPTEAGLGWAIARNKLDFIGKAAMEILETKRRLVGFELVNSAGPVPKECHLVIRNGEITGRVTSVANSATLGKVIGLAYVAPDQAADGTVFSIRVDGAQIVDARVVPLPFYDPDNARQEM